MTAVGAGEKALAAWGITPAEKRGGSVDYTAVAEAAAREREG